jgi:polyhydroxyalkanoate synthesis regulator phasin
MTAVTFDATIRYDSDHSRKETALKDFINKALLSGLGLASLTKDAIQKTVEELVESSNLSEAEGRKLVKELKGKANEVQKSVEKSVESAIHSALKSLNLEVIKDKPKTAKKSGGHKRAKKKSTGGA